MKKNVKILSFIFAVVLLVTLGCVALFAETTPEAVAQIGDTEYATLDLALKAVKSNETITVLADIDMKNAWTSQYGLASGFTIDGNGHTITNLNSPLILEATATLTIKNLTVADSKIVLPAEKPAGAGNLAAGAFIGYANAQGATTLTFDNCRVIDSTIVNEYGDGGDWTGGLVGYVEYYQGVSVKTLINECFVRNTTITSTQGGACGSLVGHVGGELTVVDSVVGGNRLDSVGRSEKVGSVVGTISPNADNFIDVTEISASVNVTASASESAPESAVVVGRRYVPVTYTGGEYVVDPQIASVGDGAATIDGLMETVDGKYIIYKAQIGEAKYTSVQAAVDAVEAEGTIELLGNCYEALTIDKKLTINLDGKQLINEPVVNAYNLVYGSYNTEADTYEVKDVTNWLQAADTSWYDASKAEFTLTTAQELAGLAKLVNEGTTFAEKTVYLDGNVDLSAATWPGIGARTKNDDTYTFRGTFDGKENAITGVTFSVESFNNYCGFFNRIVDATVKNLNVTSNGFGDATFSESDEFGGAIIVGSAKNSTIYNCVANGSITGNHNVAGIVVMIADSQITKCVNNAAVTGTYTKMAGIAAFIEGDTKGNGSAIDQCVNNGDITVAVEPKNPSANKIPGADGAGGIVGWYGYSNAANGSITNNTNNGKITVLGDNTTATIGQIAAESWSRLYVFTGNQGRIDQVATGHLPMAGLNYAIVKDGMAVYADTRMANDAPADVLVAGTTYLVTANGAAPSITLAPGESITFDQSIAKLGSVDGIKGNPCETVNGDKVTYAGALVKMGDDYYATFTEAWKKAAKNGGAQTITLLGDSTFSGATYGTDMKALALTIDLNGYALNLEKSLSVAGSMYGGNALTITDSSTAADGKMVFKNDSYIEFTNAEGGPDTLIIEGGSFVKESGNYIIRDKSWGTFNQTITLNGGDFTGVQSGKILDVDKGDKVTKSADVEVKAPEGYAWKNDTELVVAVAKLNDKAYASLNDAIAAATDGDTVTLLADYTGAGFELAHRGGDDPAIDFTLDLNGHTYTIDAPSTGKIGINIGYGNNVTILNGIIAPKAGTVVDALVRTYYDLTLSGVTLDGTNLYDGWNTPLAVYNGNITMQDTEDNTSALIAGTYGVAAWLSGNDDHGADTIGLTINTQGAVKGDIMQKYDAVNAKGEPTAVVDVTSIGTFDGEIVGSADHIVTGSDDALVTVGFGVKISIDGADYIAYKTLAEAMAAITGNSDAKIVLLKDLEGVGFELKTGSGGDNNPDPSVVEIDMNGFNYTFTAGIYNIKDNSRDDKAIRIYYYVDLIIGNSKTTGGVLSVAESGHAINTMIQSFGDVTIKDNVVLDGTNLRQWDTENWKDPFEPAKILYIPVGSFNVLDSASVIAADDVLAIQFALNQDANGFTNGVTVDTTGKFVGAIESKDWADKDASDATRANSAITIQNVGTGSDIDVKAGTITNVIVSEAAKDVVTIAATAVVNDVYYTDLAEAIAAANDGDIVTMLADAALAEQLVITKNITLDGNGHTITAAGDTWSTANDLKYLIVVGSYTVSGETVTIKNLTLDGATNDAQMFGLQFYTVDAGTLENVTVKNFGKAGLNINASNVVAKGDLILSGNGWGDAINISYGSGISKDWWTGGASLDIADANVPGGVYHDKGDLANATANGVEIEVEIPADWAVLVTTNGQTIYDSKTDVVAIAGVVMGDTYYTTLADAYDAAVNAGDKDISIKLVNSHIGAGIVVESGVKLTVDFNGCYYSINSPVGSKNTETNGFQLKEGATVVLTSTATYEDGEIALGLLYSEPNSGVKLLIQNYADLTVSNMILLGYYLDEPKDGSANYTLSINSGNVTVTNSTISADTDGDDFALDIYGWYSAYDAPVVTVTDSVIFGDIEINSDGSDEEKDKTLGFAAFENNDHDGRIVNQLDGTYEFVDASGAALEIDNIGDELEATYDAETGIWEVTPDIDFTEGVSATMTFTLVDELANATKVRILHKHGNDYYAYHVDVIDGKATIENAVGFSTFEIIDISAIADTTDFEEINKLLAVELQPGQSLTYNGYTVKAPTADENNHNVLIVDFYTDHERYALGLITYTTLDAYKEYGTTQWYMPDGTPLDGMGSYNYQYFKDTFELTVGSNHRDHYTVTPKLRPGHMYENVIDSGKKNYLNFNISHMGFNSVYDYTELNKDAYADNFIIDDSGAGTITITPATITDNFLNDETKAQTMPYNGAAQTGKFPVNADFVLVNHPKNEDTMTVRFADEAGNYNLSEAPSVKDVKDGVLTVKYRVMADNHYIHYAQYTIQISKISLADAVFTLKDPNGFTYNSTAQTVEMNPIGDGTYFVTLTVGGKTFILIEGTDYTVSGNTATNAGDYTFTITGTGNYSGTASRDWSIAQRAVGIEIITPKLTYGNAWTQESFSIEAIGDDGVDYGAEIVGIYTTTGDILYNGAHYVHAGKQTVTFTLTDDEAINNENFKFADDMTAFTADYEVAKKKITADMMVLAYDGVNYPVYYGSEKPALAGYQLTFIPGAIEAWDDVDADDFREDKYFYSTNYASTLQASTWLTYYFNGIQLTIDYKYPDYSIDSTYVTTTVDTLETAVQKRPITIKPLLKDGVDHAYGSSFAQHNFTYEITSELKLVNNDVLNLVYAVENYEVGSNAGVYNIIAEAIDNTNYAITLEASPLEITRRLLTVGVYANSVVYSMDYEQLEPYAWEFNSVDGDAWILNLLDGYRNEKGEFPADLDFGAALREVLGLDGFFTTKTDYQVGDGVDAHRIIWVEYALKEDGTQYSADDHPNFEVKLGYTVNGEFTPYSNTLTIEPYSDLTLDDIVVEFNTLYYNGLVQAPTVKSLTIWGKTLTAAEIANEKIQMAVTGKDAGTHDVVMIFNGNFGGSEIEGLKYTIKKYVVDSVNWSEGLFTYDGTAKAPTATLNINGEILTFATTGATYVGDHESLVTGLISIKDAEDNDRPASNYRFNYELIDAGLFEIAEATPVKFYSANVVLGDEYAINFKIKKLALEQYGYTAADKDAILTLSYLNEAVKSEDFTFELVGDFYVLTFLHIAPQNMGEQVTATFNSEKFVGKTWDKSYSVAEYCYSRIDVYAEDAVIGDMNDENYMFVRTLLSMLRYGEAAEMMVYGEGTLLTDPKYADMLEDYGFEPITADGYDPDTTKPVELTGKYNFNLTVAPDLSSGNKLNLSYAIPEGLTLGVDDIRVQIYDMTEKVWLMTEAGDPGVKILTEDDLNASFIMPMNAPGHEFRIVFSVNKEVVGDSFITLDMFVSSAESYIAAEALKQFGDCLNDWHKLVEMEALAA